MSSGLVGQVIEHYPGNGDELLLAIIIADNATRNGAVLSLPPSELAHLSRRSEKTVRRTLAKMEESGWLLCKERSKGGHGRPTIYQINPDWVKLPIGWSGKEPGHGDHVVAKEHGQIDHVSGQQPGQFDQVEPGHNLDNLTMFPRETAPDLEATPSLFKTIPPYIPPFSNITASGSAVPSATAADESEDMRLARWMFERVLAVHPAHRQPAWKRWLRDIAVIRRQGHSCRAIAELFAWANADEFWALNIRSPKKLWQHWDTLAMKRKRQAETKPAAPATVDPKCERCHERAWSHQQGKGGPRLCSACAAELEAAA